MNELLLGRLLRALTFRKFLNLIKTGTSFLLSAILKKNIVWGIPPTLTIEPTNICNLKCPLCTTGSGEMERVNGKMSMETFNELMKKMGDDIFFLLIYHQGEPYINKHFFDFVRIAKEKKIYVTTSTNGHYFSDKNINETIESGLDSMIVSIDGVTQESFEKYRVGDYYHWCYFPAKEIFISPGCMDEIRSFMRNPVKYISEFPGVVL